MLMLFFIIRYFFSYWMRNDVSFLLACGSKKRSSFCTYKQRLLILLMLCQIQIGVSTVPSKLQDVDVTKVSWLIFVLHIFIQIAYILTFLLLFSVSDSKEKELIKSTLSSSNQKIKFVVLTPEQSSALYSEVDTSSKEMNKKTVKTSEHKQGTLFQRVCVLFVFIVSLLS